MIRKKSKNATKLIVKAVFVKAAIFKSVVFNGKVAYRIARADSVADNTVLVPETLENDGDNEQNIGSVIFEEGLTPQIDSRTPQKHQERDDDNISIIIDNKFNRFF